MKVFWQRLHRVSPFIGHVAVTGVTNLVLLLLGVVTGILAARLLGPEGRGELAAIQLWGTTLGTVAMVGMPEALAYLCARDPEKAGRYTVGAVAIALVTSIPFVVLALLGMPALLSAQSPSVVWAASWYLLFIPLSALLGIPYHPLRGLERFGHWNVLRLLPAVLWLILLCMAWLGNWRDPKLLAGCYLAGLTLLLIPVFTVVRQTIGGPYRFSLQDQHELFAYGIPAMLASVPQMLKMRVDQIAIAAVLPPTQLGLYVVAVAWSSAVQPLTGALGSVLLPRVARPKDRSQQEKFFLQGVRVTVIVAFALALLIGALTPRAIELLFGKAFGEAAFVAVVLLVAASIAGVNAVVEDGLRGLGDAKSIVSAEGLGALANAGVLALMIVSFGILGAAVAALAGSAVTLALLIDRASKQTGLPWWVVVRPTREEILAGMRWVRAMRRGA